MLNFFAGYLSAVCHTWCHCLFPNRMVWRVHSRAAWFFDVGTCSFFFVPFRDDERRVLGSSRCRDVACRGSHGHGDRMQWKIIKDHEISNAFREGNHFLLLASPVAINMRAAWITSKWLGETEHVLGKKQRDTVVSGDSGVPNWTIIRLVQMSSNHVQ